MKSSVRASAVAVVAVATLLLLIPGSALATTPARHTGLKVDWQTENSSGLGRPEGMPAGAYAKGTFVVSTSPLDGGRIWASSDAVHWTLAWRGDSVPGPIVAAGPGFVAWADGILLSSNGRTWNPANEAVPQRLLNSVFVRLGSAGGVAVAFPESGHGYWSADGHEWHSIVGGPTKPLNLAGDGTHLWAFTGGSPFDSNSAGTPVQLWVTADGQNWTQSAQLPNSHRVHSVVAAFGPLGGAVIAGAKAWYSSDDVHWHVATNTPTLTNKGPSYIQDVIADESGFIVTARRDLPGCVVDPAQSHGLTWTSASGDVWRKMPGGKEWLGREIDQLFISGRTLYGVGIDWSEQSSAGMVWSAQLPANASDDAPPPAPPPPPGRQGC